MGGLKEGLKGSGTYYAAYPVLGLCSDGQETFMMAGGGGATSAKEVPNVVEAYRYNLASGAVTQVASLSTGLEVGVYLSHCAPLGHWLLSVKDGCKVLSFNSSDASGAPSISEICQIKTETEGKDPSQNVCKYSPGGEMLATGGTDGRVRLYSAAKAANSPPELLLELEKHGEVTDLDFSSDGKLLASCDRTGFCRMWDPSTGKELSSFQYRVKGEKQPLAIRCVRFLSTSRLLIAASGPRGPAYLGIFGLDGKKMVEVLADKKPLSCIAVDEDCAHATACITTGEKKIYSLPKLQLLQSQQRAHELPAPCCAFVKGTTVVSGSGDRVLNVMPKRAKASGGWTRFVCRLYLAALMIPLAVLLGSLAESPVVTILGPLGVGDGRKEASQVAERNATAITAMFDRVGVAYQLASKLSSFGQDNRWRDELLDQCLDPKRDDHVLEIVARTGDLSLMVAQRLDILKGGAASDGRVTALDSSEEMLQQGAAKAEELGLKNMFVARGSAEDLSQLQSIGPSGLDPRTAKAVSLPEESVNKIGVAFGFRFVADRPKVLREMRRILQKTPHSRLCVMEFWPLSFLRGESEAVQRARHILEKYAIPFLAWVTGLGGGTQAEREEFAKVLLDYPDSPRTLASNLAAEGLPVHKITSYAFGLVHLLEASPSL
eukprot:TRINITY_DN65299_c0_g1_i1.p1 TRINITY_DN65299_c0_g1~~TRINITY_DN65299_c0_g1_i1.p1  ORF type:complete len:661 (-),score=111.48 TRINITY_DN65299_c0_g1_i1:18-2000(-)